jgi:uncharacterized NAD(P)/FAD-binding protein YdhS
MVRIVILGGGFAGTACAIHLMRDHPGLRAELSVIEPRAQLGAGLAYSAPAREHRTNVAAARMTLFPEDQEHFHRWVHAQGEVARDPASEMADGRLYPSRAVFGRYVKETLDAVLADSPGVVFRHVQAEAVGMAPDGAGFRITLADGERLAAGAAVLAASHSAPDLPQPLRGCPKVIPNPWKVAALEAIPSSARVLIVGTGLTACDVLATLLARGHGGPITALSRHGLLPRPRTTLPVEAEGDFSTAPETTALGLLRRIRRAVGIATAAGRPWENIIDALRQQSAVAWGSLDWTQRRLLLRHLRSFWDVHRFQSAPQIDAAVADARERGQLTLRAASLVSAVAEGDHILVTFRPRGAKAEGEQTLACDWIVNCTGPGHRSVTATHPVLRSLAEQGGLQADPALLGILVDLRSRVIRTNGTAWQNLFVAGPLARGTHGELMGLPQVNTQPRAVAAELAALANRP